MHTFKAIAGGLLLLALCPEPDADLLTDLAQIRLLQPVAPAHCLTIAPNRETTASTASDR